LNIRVIDQSGNPVEDFITRFYFGDGQEADKIHIVHRYENEEIDCFYLKFTDLANVTQFGFHIEPNKINNTIYKQSKNIDLINKATDIHFLESGKTHLIEVMVEKSITKTAFSFEPPAII
jgi:hypothetical protein